MPSTGQMSLRITKDLNAWNKSELSMETSQNEKKTPANIDFLNILQKPTFSSSKQWLAIQKKLSRLLTLSGLVQETSRPYYIKKNFLIKD